MKKKDNETAWPAEAAPTQGVALREWLAKENKLLSGIVEETVTNANVLRMCNATAGFCTMTLAANFSLITACIGLAWFATAMIDLKKNIKKSQT